MGASSFNEMEIDAIGEIMNISLGASATAVSTMLGTAVNITTPSVKVLTSDEFEFKNLEPAVGVEIAYVEGLEGSNIMMFRRNDVRIIVGMLMGGEIPEDEFELDEINISAICEVMNQMMGSSATALSEFLGNPVNISTPVSFEIDNDEDFKSKYFPQHESMVVVRFSLEIEGKLKSEFLNIMSTELTKRLLAPFEDAFAEEQSLNAEREQQTQPEPAPAEDSISQAEPQSQPESQSQSAMSQDEIERLKASMSQPEPQSPSQSAMSQDEIERLKASMSQPEPQSQGVMSQDEIERLKASMSQPEPQSQRAMSQDEIEQLKASMSQPEAQSQPAPPQMAAAQPAPSQPAAAQPMQPVPPQPYPPYNMAQPPVYQMPAADPMMLQLLNQMQQAQAQMMEMMKDNKQRDAEREREREREREKEKERRSRESSIIRPVDPVQMEDNGGSGREEQANQEMLMKVPLEVSVEIGRTKKPVRDILEFTQGSLVVLDKMAGEQADLFVNGQCIARGDIVVVEDNFGIRITEIIARDLNAESL